MNLEVVSGLGTVTLNRPEVGNRLDLAMLSGLREVLVEVEERSRPTGSNGDSQSVHAVLLQAEGRTFCVGGDVGSFVAAGQDLPQAIRELTGVFHTAMRALAAIRVPVVVAVQGWAAGGGFSLAAGGDIMIVAESTRFSFAYKRLGLSPDGGITWLLPRQVGEARVLDWALSGKTVTAEDAFSVGLASRICRGSDPRPEAREVAAEIASGPVLALAETKRLIRQSSMRTYEEQLAEEADAMVGLGATADAHSGIESFMAKTPPTFAGR